MKPSVKIILFYIAFTQWMNGEMINIAYELNIEKQMPHKFTDTCPIPLFI